MCIAATELRSCHKSLPVLHVVIGSSRNQYNVYNIDK